MERIYTKRKLNFWQIVNMNFGFFGLQYSFGLQQANMSPIYTYLGAEESKLPYLWLAGPVTGLIVQPIVGAMSDKTISRWGRRTPYFFFGGILCSICLLIMPYSSSLWMAASTLWILDAANNMTQEPYRAFVSDHLDKSQHPLGFLTQSAFTGLGQTLSYLTPTLLILFGVSRTAESASHIPLTTIIAFIVGSVFSIGTILWTVGTTREIPLTEEQKEEIRKSRRGFLASFPEIFNALREMPSTMKWMIPMMLFSWYAIFTYWIYIAKSLSRSIFSGAKGADGGFREADILVGQLGAFYNFIAFGSAFGLAWLARKYSPKGVHGLCLLLAGLGLFFLPSINSKAMAFIPMLGLGVCWASMMGIPYAMLAGSIPPARTGVYMGIFNMFIVIPMLLQNVTMPLYYDAWLGSDPTQAIRLAGVLFVLAAISVVFIKLKPQS